MGIVYRGEHELLGREVAIKVLHARYTGEQEILKRFFNEARAATQISDPGIVQVFDYGVSDDGAYIVMERLEGESIENRLTRIGRFAPAECVRLLRMVCASLHAVHSKRIFHRDIKPSNIFIVADRAVAGGERTKLLDFGIAKLANDVSGHKTETNELVGTPAYMSPEHCRALEVDARSDIYLLGCVMMTMLTGRPPFESASATDVLVSHVIEPPPLPSERVPGLPTCIDEIVRRALYKSPDDRFQTVLEMAAALERAETSLAGADLQLAPIVDDGEATIQTPRTTLTEALGESVRVGSRHGVRVAAALGTIAIVLTLIAFTRSGEPAQPAQPPAAAPLPPVQIIPLETVDAAVPAVEVAPEIAPEPAVVEPPVVATPPSKRPRAEGARDHARPHLSPDSVDRGD